MNVEKRSYRFKKPSVFSKTKLSLLADYVLGWVLALSFLQFVRNYGIPAYHPVYLTVPQQTVMVLAFEVLAGTLFGYIQTRSEIYYQQRLPIGNLLLISLVIQITAITLIAVLIYLVYVHIFDLEEVSFGQFVQEPSFTVFFLYAILVNFVLTVLRQINLLLGPGNLTKFISGKFYYPHEEVRIFMFLDMKSSTAIAERLGHVRYSQLIQDCFSDLAVVTRFKASIYQYVGDEAVLTWKQDEGLEDHNCLRAFFKFEEQLQHKAAVYQEKYGIVPVFKAGMNLGKVTVAEVGVVKREIAFHGDTINTAARIQEKCNELDQRLLISEFLQEKLNGSPEFVRERIGTMRLRGRQESIDLYSVEKAKH